MYFPQHFGAVRLFLNVELNQNGGTNSPEAQQDSHPQDLPQIFFVRDSAVEIYG